MPSCLPIFARPQATSSAARGPEDQSGPDGQDSYIYGPSSTPIEQISSNGTELWLHHDALGSVRRIGNQAGYVVGAFTYNPYGTLAASTGTSASRFGYAGAYTDPGTGFLYLDHRYYDPSTAQFLTRDPLEAITGQPYSYANDNPINGTDPTGLCGGFLDLGCVGDAIGSGANWVASIRGRW